MASNVRNGVKLDSIAVLQGVAKAAGPDIVSSIGRLFGENRELSFAIICGVLLAVGFLLSFFRVVPTWAALGLYVASYGFGGFYQLHDAFTSLRERRFNHAEAVVFVRLTHVKLGRHEILRK